MVIHGVVNSASHQQLPAQKPDAAVMYTAIEVFLKDMDDGEVQRLIGTNEETLKSLVSITRAKVTYNPTALVVSISGELSRVRAAYQIFKSQMNLIRERGVFDELDLNLLGKEFAGGIKFSPSQNGEIWTLQPFKLVKTQVLEGDDSGHTVEHISAELLKRFSYLVVNKEMGLKMNFNLGMSTFMKSFANDMRMEYVKLTPLQLIQLIESKDLICHHDLSHDEKSLDKLERALVFLGYQKSAVTKTRIYISHREIVDRRAKEILWVAKPTEVQITNAKGHLEMVDVRINESCACLITTHSGSNVLDCHVEFTIYQKENPSALLLHSGRLGHNFRYRPGADSLICSKEDLKDPSARVRCSTAYIRDDITITITKIRESKSLIELNEVRAKSAKLKAVIRSALSGESVTNAQLSTELRNYFLSITQIRASFNGAGVLTELGNMNSQNLKVQASPRKSLNAAAEPFEPRITVCSSSEETAKQVEASPQNLKEKSAFTGSGFSSQSDPPQIPPTPKTIDFPALKCYVAARQLPTPVIQSSLMFPQLQKLPEPNELDTDRVVLKQERGKIPPPNTPVTPSGPGSPAPSPIRSARSRADSMVLIDEDDVLCGTRISSVQQKKTPPDLLGSIDEFLRESIHHRDEDLICMSPLKQALQAVDEDEDLLVI